jgi:hypothetical protein
MAASYPGSVKTFTTRSTGQSIEAQHMNDVQDEVAAVESSLLNGFTHTVLPFSHATYKIGTALYQWLEAWAATLYSGGRAYLDYDTTATDSGGITLYRGNGSVARSYFWRLNNYVVSGSTSLLRFLHHNGTSESVVGSLNSNGMLTVGGLVLTGIDTPATLGAASNHNVAVAANAVIVRLGGDSGGGSIITGISASQVKGRVLYLCNCSLYDIVINHDDAGSNAANRFYLPDAVATWRLDKGDSLAVWYDDTSGTYWRVLDQSAISTAT